ncbi:putative digeranylgeranylglycerophospholipid reductase [Nitrososphaera viennensis EN76]|nr:putative digeranylgeranylglycerophospholipid reductase [Nitrososphaera viennensis EN76]
MERSLSRQGETMVERYEIAVVGGGPAGLSAAWAAAKAGASVILFEKDEAIAHSVRTSGVSWIDSMDALGIPSNLYNPISSYQFVSPSNEVTIAGSNPRSCVLDVRATYQHLAFMAAEAGAKMMVRSNVINVVKKEKENGRVVAGVKASTPAGDLEVSCPLVIDASGFGTSAARRAGMAGEWKRYGVGAEYECYCDHADSALWTLMVGQQYSEAGYAWVFPLSRNRVRIGVGIGRPESQADPLDKLHAILEKRLKPLDKLGKIQPVELHYGFIPNEGTRASTVADGLLMVGDSAGQANPLVLEGIRYAIEFGRLAGEVGARSLEKGATRESLLDYEKAWKSKVASKIASALKVQSRWIGLSDEEWDREIEILRDMSADEFIDFVKAEFSAGKMMKLALHHPKLAARQLFNMVLKG